MDIKDIRKKDFVCQLPEDFIESLPEGVGIYAVGGSVRDAYVPGLTARELDLLLTCISQKDLMPILKAHGKARLVGRSFSVIKWSPSECEPVDVSLPAVRDLALLNGCSIDPNFPLEKDLAQRDFTINAMAYDLRDDVLIDPFGGRNDLAEGVLRAVSENSLNADAIRCIRATYVCARCELSPDEATIGMIKSAVPKLADVAPERIGEELKKLLVHLPAPSKALRLWQKWGILDIVLPELAEGAGIVQEGGWHAHDVFEHGLHAVDSAIPDFEVRLAALLHDIGKPRRKRYDKERAKATFYGHQNVSEKMAVRIMKRLKYSNETIDRVSRMVRFHMFMRCQTDKGVRRFIRNVGEDLIDSLFELRYADVEAQGTNRDDSDDRKYHAYIRKILDEKPPLSVTDLAINGQDVMELLGISEGVTVGKVLNFLLERVIDDPSLNTRESLLELIRAYFRKKDL